jgi:flagellar hook protein FlgE
MRLTVLKLASGEVILGAVVQETDDDITVENPVHVHIQPQMDPRPGQQNNITMSMMLLPAAPYAASKQMVINRFHVVSQMEVSDDIATNYRAQYAGLSLPSPSLLI